MSSINSASENDSEIFNAAIQMSFNSLFMIKMFIVFFLLKPSFYIQQPKLYSLKLCMTRSAVNYAEYCQDPQPGLYARLMSYPELRQSRYFTAS